MPKHSNKNIKAAGCFPAGTKVNTPSGYKFIEDLKKGDEVFAFDLTAMEAGEPDLHPGRIFVKKITKTFKHSFGEVGYTSKLLEISYASEEDEHHEHDGTLIVTGNHYILTPSKQSEETDEGFARADQLEVGDYIWTEYGDKVKITSVKEGDEYDFVYNFEVAKLHTYIAGGIRVHNGGGGKGGSSHTPVQAANTTRTDQVIRVLVGGMPGEIAGLYNSADIAQSVFLDNTVLKNPDGSYNFKNVSVEQRVGLPDQTVIKGFSAVEAENLLNLALTTTTPVTRTMAATSDAARITIKFIQGLQNIDIKSGDANGTSVAFVIQRRISLGTWETVISPTVTEMSSGPFTAAFMIDRPAATGAWEWRVTRTTADSTQNQLINATQISSYTDIQNANLAYNNFALVALTIGADSTDGRIPTIALDLMGKKVKVPSNYNPVTHTFSGTWDGTFSSTLQWTDDPAWVIYDLIQSPVYGLGDKISEAQIDKFSFYKASVYNNELVNDGKGTGTFEPRFTFNAQLMVQEDAWKTLNTIAATMNAKVHMHAGYVRIAQDAPGTPTRIINNSNVIEGLFTYSSTPADQTYTQVNVVYNDPDDNFLPKTVSEQASVADRARFQFRASDLAAYGAASEGQARRAAKWLLDTSIKQTAMVSFGVGLENAAFEPNEIFYLMDEDYSQTTQEGRLLAVNGTTLTLDKPITKTTGTWKITVYGADGTTLEERVITSGAGTSATISIASGISGGPNSAYVVTGAVAPRQFRLLNMTDNGDLTYTVLAVAYDPNKYARIETGVIIPDDVYWQQPSLNKINTPTNMTAVVEAAVNPDGVIHRVVNVAWTPPADGTAVGYQFQYRRNSQPLQVMTLRDAYARVPADFGGSYEFYVNAVNTAGVASPTLGATFIYDFSEATGSTIGSVTGLQLAGGGTTFGTGAMNVLWTAPADVNGSPLKDYKVELQVPGGAVYKTFYTSVNGFIYTMEENIADGGPRTSIQVNVYARDTQNRLGAKSTTTFSASAPSSISGLQVRNTGGTTFTTLDLDVEWTATTTGGLPIKNDPNFGFFKVEVLNGTTVKRTDQVQDSNYSYTFSDNVKDNGQDTPSNAIIIRVTVVSKFGLNSASGAATFTPAAPPTPTGLTVQGKAAGTTTFDTLDCQVEWTCTQFGSNFAASNMFKRYKVEVLKGAASSRTEYVAPDAKYEYTFANNILDNGQDNPSAAIIVRVTAENVYNVAGTPISVTFAPAAPPICTGLYVVNTTNTTFIANDLEIEWDCNTTTGGNFVGSNMFKEFRVRAYNSTTLKRTDIATTDKYSYDYFKNQTDNGGSAIRTPILEVTSRNVYNVYGTPASATFQNAAPSAPNVTTTPGVDMIFIDVVRQAADIDVEGYVYHISTTSGFTPSGTVAGSGTCVYAGPNSSITYKVTGGVTYYVKVAAYDGFGLTGLQYSTQTNGAVTLPVTGYDYQFPGFTYSASGNTASWSAGTAAKVAGVGAPASYSVSAGTAAWSSGTVYIYWDEASPTVFQSTTTLATATGLQKRIVAVYKGGTNISSTDGKVMIDGTTTIFPGTINSSLLVTGAAVITGEAQMGTATINAAAIKDLAVTNGKIADLSVNSLKLANGSVSDSRFYVSNTSTTLASTSATGNFEVASTIVAELAITTPNPTGLTGPFPTYIHASLSTNTRINGAVQLNNGAVLNNDTGGGGVNNVNSVTLSSNLTIFGVPKWQLRVVNSLGAVIAQTDILLNGSGVTSGGASVNNGATINNGSGGGGTGNTNSISITQNISTSGGSGLNLLFLAPALAANTAYKIQLVASGNLQVTLNSLSTPVSLTADQRAIYYQCLLR